MGHDRLGEAFQPVAALQHGDQPSTAVFFGDGLDDTRQVREIVGRQCHVAEGIMFVGVEPGGDEEEIRPKRVGGRDELVLERPPILPAAAAARRAGALAAFCQVVADLSAGVGGQDEKPLQRATTRLF